MPIVDWSDVAESRVIPVGQVDAPVRAHSGKDRPEPTVRGINQILLVDGPETRTVLINFTYPDYVVQGIGCDDLSLECGVVKPAVIDTECLGEAPAVSLVAHMLEISEGIGIGQGTVLAPILLAVTTLRVMHAPGIAVVRA